MPVAGGLLGMIFLPGALFRALQSLFPSIAVDDRFVCRLSQLSARRSLLTLQ